MRCCCCWEDAEGDGGVAGLVAGDLGGFVSFSQIDFMSLTLHGRSFDLLSVGGLAGGLLKLTFGLLFVGRWEAGLLIFLRWEDDEADDGEDGCCCPRGPNNLRYPEPTELSSRVETSHRDTDNDAV